MNQLIIFDDPALAHTVREAGLFVFRQRYNGRECFAAQDCPVLQEVLANAKRTYGATQYAVAHTLHF